MQRTINKKREQRSKNTAPIISVQIRTIGKAPLAAREYEVSFFIPKKKQMKTVFI
jgi:hypothetical protein